MAELILGAFIIAAAYFIGAIPIGLLVGKTFYGIDIREQGSGNLGATNAYRALGPVGGAAVFIGDVAKGALPVLAMKLLVGGLADPLHSLLLVLTGLAAIAGHNWPVYLHFKGGKGVSTAAGVLVVLFPQITAILLVIWIVVLALTRYVSVASMTIAVVFPVLVLVFERQNYVYIGFSLIACLVVLFRHRTNFGRLLARCEPKMWGGRAKER